MNIGFINDSNTGDPLMVTVYTHSYNEGKAPGMIYYALQGVRRPPKTFLGKVWHYGVLGEPVPTPKETNDPGFPEDDPVPVTENQYILDDSNAG